MGIILFHLLPRFPVGGIFIRLGDCELGRCSLEDVDESDVHAGDFGRIIIDDADQVAGLLFLDADFLGQFPSQ